MTSISTPINPHWQRASGKRKIISRAGQQPFCGSLTGLILRAISALLAMLIAGAVLFWIGHNLINTVENVGKGHVARLERELGM